MIGETGSRPRVGLVLGDPAGIGAELAAKLLAEPQTLEGARVRVIGDARQLAAGAKIAQVALPAVEIDDRGNADPAALALGRVSAAGGRAALDNFRHALARALDGALDAIVFTPFNKQALRLGGMTFDDELRFAADFLGYTGPHGEFNVLDRLWNARVTSHLRSPTARCTRPASRRRASRWPRSIRMPAMAAIMAAKRSRSSRRRWTRRVRRV